MRLAKAWLVATKDLAVLRKKRSILYSVVAFPLGAGVGLPLVVRYADVHSGGIPLPYLTGLLEAFAFFFMIGAAVLPNAIASYSLVGEKLEKSLEPLLATPTTDSEILLGKTLASLLPPLGATYVGATVYMVLADAFTVHRYGYYLFPNLTMAVLFGLVTPLVCLSSVEGSVVISSFVTDVRAAQQLASLLILPFVGLYVAGEIGLLRLDAFHLLLLAPALLAADIVLLFVSRALFQRDQILTRWK